MRLKTVIFLVLLLFFPLLTLNKVMGRNLENLDDKKKELMKVVDVTKYYKNFNCISKETFPFNPSTWIKRYGGDFADEAYSVASTTDGGYILAGYTNSFGLLFEDVLVVKITSSGKVLWAKMYGGNLVDKAISIIRTSNDEFLIVGFTSSFGNINGDGLVFKINSNGDVIWSRVYGGNHMDVFYSAVESKDGYEILGYTYSFGNGKEDMWLVKLSFSGSLLWSKIYGGVKSDLGLGLKKDFDGGLLLTGRTDSYGNDGDIILIKVDQKGSVKWDKVYRGECFNIIYSIEKTSDGGYVLGGSSKSSGDNGWDFLVVKLDSKGCVEWSKTFGSYNDEVSFSLVRTVSGFFLVGYELDSNFDFYRGLLLRIDKNGDLNWSKIFDQGSSYIPYFVTNSSEGGFLIAGGLESDYYGKYDFSLLKLGSNLDIEGCSFFKDYHILENNINLTVTSPDIIEYSPSTSSSEVLLNSLVAPIKVYNVCPIIPWAKIYSNVSSNICTSIVKSSDNNYVILGNTSSLGNSDNDILIFKLDSYGNIIWAKNYDGGGDDFGSEIVESCYGCYIIVGKTNSFGSGNYDVLVMKIDELGSIVWCDVLGAYYNDYGGSLIQISCDELDIIGYTNSYGIGSYDTFVAKLDYNGNVIWSKAYGKSNKDDKGHFILKTSDGDFLIGGVTVSTGDSNGIDSFLVKLDANGNLLWSKTYGDDRDLVFKSAIETEDGGFLIFGESVLHGIWRDLLVVRLNSTGELKWAETFECKGTIHLNSVVKTYDGKYMLVGKSNILNNEDVFVMELDCDGNIIFSKIFGSDGNEEAFSVEEICKDWSFIIGKADSFGNGRSDILLLKLPYLGDFNYCPYLRDFYPSPVKMDLVEKSEDITVTPFMFHEDENCYFMDRNVSLEQTKICPLLGDLDGNGIININDVLLLKEYLVGNFLDIERGMADMDESGRIDNVDLMLLLFKLSR